MSKDSINRWEKEKRPGKVGRASLWWHFQCRTKPWVLCSRREGIRVHKDEDKGEIVCGILK